MKIRSVCFKLFIFVLLVCQNAIAQKICPVIPLPNNNEQSKETFVLNKNTSIIIKDTSLNSLAVFLQQSIKSYKGVSLKINNQGKVSMIILEKK